MKLNEIGINIENIKIYTSRLYSTKLSKVYECQHD